MRRPFVAVGVLVALGAALRVLGLDAKGFWEDEALTVIEVRHGLGSMLSGLTDFENNPPLYYVLAWGWTRAFGDGEVGIRSLSVVLGTLTIPVVYSAGRALVSSRAGIIAAALVAVNPLLIWYSQEARTYALFVLLSALALLFFARALRDPSPSNLALWSLSSALAVTAHYFAAFPFAVEAVWLLVTLGMSRGILLAATVPAVVGAALIPLAVAQVEGPRHWIQEIGMLGRVVQVPGFFLVGFEASFPLILGLAAAAAVLAGIGLLLLFGSGTAGERRGGGVALGVGVFSIAIPLALALVGVDYFVYKNVIAALIPFAIAIAAGLGAAQAGRAGPAAAAGLVGLSVAIVIATASEPKYQRETWREAAEALGDPDGARAIVSTPGDPGREPFEVYLPDARPIESGPVRVIEIDLVALPRRGLGEVANARLPDVEAPPGPPASGFELVETRDDAHLLLYRYRSDRARRISYERLRSAGVDQEATPMVYVERPEVG